MTTIADTSTKLRPPWLNITRALWIVLSAAAVVVFAISTVISLREPLPSCSSPDTTCGPWMVTQEDFDLAQQSGLPVRLMTLVYFASMIIPRVVFFLVGLIVFVRRSDDWMAQMLSLMLTLFLVEGIQNLGPAMPLVNALYLVATVLFILLLFIFPNGRFVPEWMGWLVVPLLILTVVATTLPQLSVPVTSSLYAMSLLATFLLWFLAAGYSSVYRFKRVSTPTERQQTKWVVAGILGTFLLFVPFTIASIWFPPVEPSLERLAFMFLMFTPFYVVSYLAVPVGIAFAILRYRLWDIDVIIRKTLVYAVLTALLALVFFGIVTLLTSLFSMVSGQQSALAIVVSTLAIAALFNPLRRRVQNGIDRRFFRKKYDAQQVLAQFALTARDETDLEALTAELVHVVQETMQPEYVSVRLIKHLE